VIGVTDLYDYSEIRGLQRPTVFVAHANRATLVLGSSQPTEVLNATAVASTPLRRRRGGGGLVLLRPKDLWVDWWIPAGDPRWSSDLRASSVLVGTWWAAALRATGTLAIVHEGPLEGEPAFRVVCFAGRGPGEVFVNGRKAVGLTQWRVREGLLVSTVLHAEPTSDVLQYLAAVPEGLDAALDHHVLSSLANVDPADLLERLHDASGAFETRDFELT
jgi:lipoate---protein ligase